MPRRYHEGLVWAELLLRTVVHGYSQPSRDYVAHVRYQAAVGSCERLDVLRPPPPRLESGTPYGDIAKFYYIHLPVIERARLIREFRFLPERRIPSAQKYDLGGSGSS